MKISAFLATVLLFVSASEAWHVTLWGLYDIHNEGGHSVKCCNSIFWDEFKRLGKVYQVYFNPSTSFHTDPTEVIFYTKMGCEGKEVLSMKKKGRAEMKMLPKVIRNYALRWPKTNLLGFPDCTDWVESPNRPNR
jgi:hypothetical protein